MMPRDPDLERLRVECLRLAVECHNGDPVETARQFYGFIAEQDVRPSPVTMETVLELLKNWNPPKRPLALAVKDTLIVVSPTEVRLHFSEKEADFSDRNHAFSFSPESAKRLATAIQLALESGE